MAVVRAATALTALSTRASDPIRSCNVCGHESDSLRAWREHDEWDQPIKGTAALVYIGNDHRDCIKAMEKHPRLYAEEMGLPGSFPRLCGGCTYRSGLSCTHPKLKANGGPGLSVGLDGFGIGAIVCTRGGGCHTPIKHALTCEGQALATDASPIDSTKTGEARPAAPAADETTGATASGGARESEGTPEGPAALRGGVGWDDEVSPTCNACDDTGECGHCSGEGGRCNCGAPGGYCLCAACPDCKGSGVCRECK